jgi:hypothetical protein
MKGLFFAGRIVLLKLFDNLQYLVTTHYGVVSHELERRGIFKNYGAANEALNPLAVFGEECESPLLLAGITENADENNGGMEIAGDIHVVHCDEPGFGDIELAADNLANFALQ